MGLNLMYITNQPEVARIAEAAGVQRIFVDMEYIGKDARQAGMDTVKNHHTIADVRAIKNAVTNAQVMCRVNPIHPATDAYGSSEEEINGAIEAGADILMLPFFKTAEEVREFVRLVDGRVRTLLLFETPEAVENLDEILDVPGIDEVFIGLNDLSLGYGLHFMFALLADGTVEKICRRFAERNLPYGFGGIASLGHGLLPSEYVIREHYRLNSTCVILSRSFCDVQEMESLDEIRDVFHRGIHDIHALEQECADRIGDAAYFEQNRQEVVRRVGLVGAV